MIHLPMLKIAFAVVCLASIHVCSGDSLTNVQDLYDTLFVNSKYNRNIRGIADQTEVVRVGANFSLITVGEVMEKEEAFSVMGLLYLSWKDERLVWDPNDYNGTKQIVVYQDTVWKPEIKLANPLLGVHTLGVERSQVRVLNTGEVKWAIPDVYTATCKMDVISFPWDRQSCSLDFIVSTYAPSEVMVEEDSHQIGYLKFEESELWEVVKTSVVSHTEDVSEVEFWLCLDRRPSFYFAVILVPIIALSLLNVFAFFVKVDSGERISFSITLLLSITLYLSMIPDKLPSHSKGMSAIIYCLNLVLAESMFICIMSIYSMHVYHKRSAPSVTCQKIAMRLLGRRCNHARSADHTDDNATDTDDVVADFEKDSSGGNDTIATDNTDLGVSWIDVSLLIDRGFGLVASIAIPSCLIFFASYVINSRKECM